MKPRGKLSQTAENAGSVARKLCKIDICLDHLVKATRLLSVHGPSRKVFASESCAP